MGLAWVTAPPPLLSSLGRDDEVQQLARLSHVLEVPVGKGPRATTGSPTGIT